jgi:hypothetical protein
MRLFGILLAVCWVGVCGAQQMDFKGAKVGMTPAEVKQLWPELQCSNVQERIAQSILPRDRDLWQSRATTADVYCEATFTDRDPNGGLIDIAGFRATRIQFKFFGDRFLYGTAYFRSTGFDQVAEALAAKYGPPTKTETEAVTNRLGGVFTNTTLSWGGRPVMIQLDRFYGTLDTAAYSLITEEHVKEYARRTQERSRADAKNL